MLWIYFGICMHLNDYEQLLIKKIANETITDLDSFFNKEMHVSRSSSCEFYIASFNPEEIKDNIEKTIRFLKLWGSLTNKSLVLTVESPIHEEPPALLTNSSVHYGNINLLLPSFWNKKILPTPDLDDFIQNDFLTIDELNYQQEKRARKIANWITIGIALLTLLISTLFNYFALRNEKKSAIVYSSFKPTDTLIVKVPK